MRNAPCVIGCPCGCLTKDAGTGFTLYNTSNCIGCRSCAMACPYGIPSFGEDGKMKKCDACIERQKAGMLPACIKVCPTGALTLLTEEEFVKRQEKERAKKAEEMLREYSKTDYR
ncbi:MAG: 4Fe-4S binding protein [Dorea sp.]|nr:4Fe-4S binding protein [Dorea sp.]